MARTKGVIAKGVDNKAVRDFLLAHGQLSHQPSIVDHSIRGAKGQEKDSHRYSNERLLAMLKQLEYIDTITVHNQMQAYNIASGNDKAPSMRNVQRLTRVLRCASNGIQYHAKKWRKNEGDTEVSTVSVINFSDEEREKFRLWVKAGELDKAKDLAKSCGMVTRSYELPQMQHMGDNVLGFSPPNIKRNLEPLTQVIKEIGRRYTFSKKAA